MDHFRERPKPDAVPFPAVSDFAPLVLHPQRMDDARDYRLRKNYVARVEALDLPSIQGRFSRVLRAVLV